MKIGVYVGSFNPVHIGHIKIVNELIENKIIDKIIIVPTGNYWDKKDLINIEDRINMLKFFENENIIIDTKRYKYEFTYQVIDSIKEDYSDEIFLIIGSDNLERFHMWKNVDKILQNKVIVVSRPGNDIKRYVSKSENFIVIDKIGDTNISSTEARLKIKNNELLSDILDERVIDYIQNKNLYRGE